MQDALSLSKDFFDEIVQPAMARECPQILEQAAIGRFGWGSECFGMDDEVSRDHHWGPRIDLLLPDAVFNDAGQGVWERVSSAFPQQYCGFELEPGHVGGAGLAPEGIGSFLARTIGIVKAPETPAEWLGIPEEDILHVVNGEVWHDGAGRFTHVREVLKGYYPDEVWKRRIAHWCRYASGMGIYAVHRALLRNNIAYAWTATARTIKLSTELIFLLSRQYFPYDKWLYPTLLHEKLAPELEPLIARVLEGAQSWEERERLIEQWHDYLDQWMIRLELVSPHPPYKRNETSGYRLLERCYHQIASELPPELLPMIPQTEQRFMEEYVVQYVAGLDDSTWLGLLNLEPREDAEK